MTSSSAGRGNISPKRRSATFFGNETRSPPSQQPKPRLSSRSRIEVDSRRTIHSLAQPYQQVLAGTSLCSHHRRADPARPLGYITVLNHRGNLQPMCQDAAVESSVRPTFLVYDWCLRTSQKQRLRSRSGQANICRAPCNKFAPATNFDIMNHRAPKHEERLVVIPVSRPNLLDTLHSDRGG